MSGDWSDAPDTPQALARALWDGPLADAAAPGAALAGHIRSGLGYDPALAMLRALHGPALPCAGALAAAAARWPGSIDIALIAAEGAPDMGAAARAQARTRLAALIRDTGRRAEAQARLLWRIGEFHAARAVLAGPAKALSDAALLTRLDLALQAGDWEGAAADLAALSPRLSPGHHRALSLRLLWLRNGAAALVCAQGKAFGSGGGATPQTARAPGLWRMLLRLHLAGQDFPRAEKALARLTALTGAKHPQTRAASVALALERDDAATAHRLLAQEDAQDTPWLWPPRRHMQALRAGLLQARDQTEPQPHLAALAAHAGAARRLHARHAGLAALDWTCRMAAGDWEGLTAELTALESGVEPLPAQTTVPAALTLGRLGLPDAGLHLLDANAPPADAPPDLTARHHLARARLRREAGLPADAPVRLAPLSASRAADLALEQATRALDTGDTATARKLLASHLHRFPRRPALWLAQARAAFLRGDFNGAGRALHRFRLLKTAQRGTPPDPDLRDMITEDAQHAARALPAGALAGPAGRVIAHLGPAPPSASAGLAACLLARAQTEGALPIQPVTGAIPPRLIHYWEGPDSPPVTRNLAAWAAQHPGMTQALFGPQAAQDWLNLHDPALARLFTALTQPAARADLFRLAILAREGGVWADTDEYPRAPITGWLDRACAVFVREPGFGTVANNFIAAAPGLGVLAQARALALDAVAARLDAGETPYPWRDSGPAVMTRAVAAALFSQGGAPGLRLLTPQDYAGTVATNLPLPHKRSALHWR